MLNLDEIFDRADELASSTIHLRAGKAPVVRVHGELIELEMPSTSDPELVALARQEIPRTLLGDYERDGDVSFLHIEDERRFKGSFFRVVDGHGFVFKRITEHQPSLEELGLPTWLEDYLGMRTGLVLLTGPIGCGKTTTQTALLNKLNRERSVHVVTVEDPIELVHEDGHCLIQQSEVGTHVTSLSEGVDLARKVGPDILFVSELHQRSTVDAILEAADGGMIVVATVHASSVIQAVAKLECLFEAEGRTRFRRRLAQVLRVVACQVLVHKQYGSGVVPVFEVLTNNAEAQDILRSGEYERLRGVMEKNRGIGMCSLDDALYDMVVHNKVLVDDAVVYAVHKDRFDACRKLPQMT